MHVQIWRISGKDTMDSMNSLMLTGIGAQNDSHPNVYKKQQHHSYSEQQTFISAEFLMDDRLPDVSSTFVWNEAKAKATATATATATVSAHT